ncbi:MAG: hypothetical protein QOJ58_4652, partial [Alphaproteobacteria bacterium]|nr:hypothetical protein [Alphaproteobacteria bacterium]
MARRPPEASKTSLYRLRLDSSRSEIEATQKKYLDRGFETKEVYIDGRRALLVYGMIPNDHPDWIDHVKSLTTFSPEVTNNTSAGLLIVRLD